MSVKVELAGLDELRAALRNLPADLAREAGAIVLAHAEQAAFRDPIEHSLWRHPQLPR